MGLTTDGMSPADLAAVTGNNNGAFGEGNGAWWIIILFLFIFCGWGNGNGWNNNARAILDALTAQRIEAKDAKIAEQNQQLFAAQLAASQASQNETLKAYMQGQFTYYNPRPVPAFPVSAPYQYGNCGCNTGCGC